MAPGPDRLDEAVDPDEFEPADATWPFLDFPNDLDIKMGVSYFTREKLFDALVVILSLK